VAGRRLVLGGVLALALAAPAAADQTLQAAPHDRYTTDSVTIAGGEGLTFQNLDVDQHNVTATATGPDGKPLFASKTIGSNESAPVGGVRSLPAGTYDFVCSLHPFMKGRLVVQGNGSAGGGSGGGSGAGGGSLSTTDTTPPDLRVALVGRRATARRVTVRIVLDEPAAVTLVARAGRATVGRASARLAKGPHRLGIALSRRARRLTVRASAVDAAGNEAVAAASRR